MIQTPSKHLSRGFLRELLQTRCISSGGGEYCEAEVFDLLMEKETRLAQQDWEHAMKEESKRYAPSLVDLAEQVTPWQSTINTLSFSSPDTTNLLEPQTNTRLNHNSPTVEAAVGGLVAIAVTPITLKSNKPRAVFPSATPKKRSKRREPAMKGLGKEISYEECQRQIQATIAYLKRLAGSSEPVEPAKRKAK